MEKPLARKKNQEMLIIQSMNVKNVVHWQKRKKKYANLRS